MGPAYPGGRLPSDRKSCTLVSSIIGLAHAFDMTTVAEGVETQDQLEHLVRQGCDESQGYLHSKPLPKEEFEGWLTDSAGAATNGSGLKRGWGLAQNDRALVAPLRFRDGAAAHCLSEPFASYPAAAPTPRMPGSSSSEDSTWRSLPGRRSPG
jgi:hypothetical protein